MIAAPFRALRLACPLLLLALLGAAPAWAHDFWIEPSTFTPAPGARVAVHLRVGQEFKGDPVPRTDARIERFAAVGPAGEAPIPGVDGTDPAGFATLAQPGLYLLVFDSDRAAVELPGPKFEEYLGLEGLERIHDLRARKNQTALPGREVYSRNVKSLLTVGSPAGAKGYDRVLGLDLELIPGKDPTRLANTEKLPLRLLYRGAPLAGAKVVALRKDRPKPAAETRTDKKGYAELPIDGPGIWLIKAVHMIPAPKGANADWESFWASLTFQRR
jgi:uncharacterized GH25 family protein